MSDMKLTAEQEQAVRHAGGPLLIVAGAGTGKTTVITERIAQLIQSGRARAAQIIALTFTEKAALEMQLRVERLLDTSYLDLSISTFHSFAERFLQEYGLEGGLPNRFKVLSPGQAWLLVHQHLDSFSLNYFKPVGNPTRHIHEFLTYFSRLKDNLIAPQAYLEMVEAKYLDRDGAKSEDYERHHELATVYHEYQQLLRREGMVDFGDLIMLAVDLLAKRPYVRKKILARFPFVLVDEFQDVNKAQYELTKLLTTPTSELTVVGDDDQGIYGFRGASVEHILRFKDDFPSATPLLLTHNYRSDQKILDAAYRLIQHNNPERLEVKLGLDKHLVAHRQFDDGGVSIHTFDRADEEVAFAIETIKTLKEKQTDVGWKDFAILARAMNHVEPFIKALERQGIPVETRLNTSWHQTAVVVNSLNFLRLVADHHHNQALFRLIHLPFAELSSEDRREFLFFAKKKALNYFDALERHREIALSQEGAAWLDKLRSWIVRGMNEAGTEPPLTVLYRFLESAGYLHFLSRPQNPNPSELAALTNLLELIKGFEERERGRVTVGQFLTYYELFERANEDIEAPAASGETDAVQVLTVHASKGLEFRYVFVVNAVEERFPTRRRSEGLALPEEDSATEADPNTGHYAEERRLMYVALTRGKERVFVTMARDYGGAREKKPSRFIAEIGLEPETAVATLVPDKFFAPPSQTAAPSAPAKSFELPRAFSFSQLKSYETCPYQYYLMHVLKIPSKGSPYFSFGQTLHSTLQKFYERMQELNAVKQASLFDTGGSATVASSAGLKVPSRDELFALYTASWIEDWYDTPKQKEQYFADGKKILADFYERNAAAGWRIPARLEGWFKISVESYLVHGRIDRIDVLPDKTLEIIDYKTGNPKDKLSAEDKEQLLLYQLAVQTLPEYTFLGTPKMLTYYYLNNNSTVSFLGTGEEITKLKDRIVACIKRIETGDFTATPSPFVCDHCDFRSICDFRAR